MAPASTSQGALVARSLLEPGGTAAVGSTDATATETKEAPPRVLKPFGLHMLPYNDPRREAADRAKPEVTAKLQAEASEANPTEPTPQEARSEESPPALAEQDVIPDAEMPPVEDRGTAEAAAEPVARPDQAEADPPSPAFSVE